MLTFQNGFQEHKTAKTSDAEGTRFTTMLQVRVGVVGHHAMRLVGNHTQFRAIQE